MKFENASQAVAVAVKAIFHRWTALRLVIEHQFGGSETHSGVNELLEMTIAMATDPTKRHNLDAYISTFCAAFNKMNTDLEDGSPEEVARHILRIRDSAARGDFAPAMAAVQKANVADQAFAKSVYAEGDSHHEDENTLQQMDSRPPRREPIVDDDGFTQVVSGKHR